MRPGCDRPAAARVAFDPVGLQLWLDPLSRRAAPVQELCDFHVERLTIPRGWSATDRRSGVVAASVAAPLVVVEPVPVPDVEPEPAVLVVEPESELELESELVSELVAEPELEPVSALELLPEPEPELDRLLEPEPQVSEPEPEPEPELLVLEPEPELLVSEPEPQPEVSEPASGPEHAAATERRTPGRSGRSRAARSPAPSLLSRAFELTGHQESVLTRPADDAAPDDTSD